MMESRQQKKLENTQAAITKNDEYYETGSIASRAKMVEQFNQKKKR